MTLATEAEADLEYAHNVGAERTSQRWILSDRDAWYRNPFYQAPEYELRQSVAFDGVSFFGWMVVRVGEPHPVTAINHATPLAAWRELRLLQERDTVIAEVHPESDGMSEQEIDDCARLRLDIAWRKSEPREEPAPDEVDNGEWDLPF